jgi:hypothetical protein
MTITRTSGDHHGLFFDSIGQTEKKLFRVTPESGRCPIQSACRKRAKREMSCGLATAATAREYIERMLSHSIAGDNLALLGPAAAG